MTKNEFLDKIREGLADLSSADVERTVDFYREIIEDREEEGRTEEEAIAALGDVDLIIENVRKEREADASPAEVEPPRLKNSRGAGDGAKRALAILLSIGSVLYSLVFYAMIIALGMSAVALAGVTLSAVPAAIINLFSGTLAQSILMLGIAALGASLAIIFAVCTRLTVKYGRLVSKWLVSLSENIGK